MYIKILPVSASPTAAVAIVAQSQCDTIQIQESQGNTGWPTTAFLISKNTGTPFSPVASSQLQLTAGLSYTFQNAFGVTGRPFYPGETAGYVQLISGGSANTNFIQDET